MPALKFHAPLDPDFQPAVLWSRAVEAQARQKANAVLAGGFPDLAARIRVSLPDEKSRRLGQAVAAASLPVIERSNAFSSARAL